MLITWVVKASKLCNLRCNYCYEWDDLANPSRMSVEVWANLFQTAVDAHQFERERHERVRTQFVWHGGEPLLLRRAYFQEVLACQNEALRSIDGEYSNSLQTNLYKIRDEDVVWLHKEWGFGFGVSVDVVVGVRVNVAGKASQPTVVENLDRLNALGVKFGGIAVLAKHTATQVRQIHEFFYSRNMQYRLLPLFAGPESRNRDAFDLSSTDAVSALCKLFSYLWDLSLPIEMDPLADYLQMVILSIAGMKRYEDGDFPPEDSIFVVNTDGGVFVRRDAYEEGRDLISLASPKKYERLLYSPNFIKSKEEGLSLQKRYCFDCKYRSVCNGSPVLQARPDVVGDGCGIAKPVMKYIEDVLISEGVTPSQLINDAFGRNIFECDESSMSAA